MKSKEHLDESFKFRLEILSKEIDLTSKTIERIDGIAHSIKNWAILVWAGSVSVFLGAEELRKYLILTAFLPLMFWTSDVWWRYLQKRSVVRQRKIAEFLNSQDFVDSFEARQFKNFYLLDPVGATHRKDEDYRKAVNISKIFRYKEISWFYGGLMLLSVVLGLFALFLF